MDTDRLHAIGAASASSRKQKAQRRITRAERMIPEEIKTCDSESQGQKGVATTK